MELTKKHKEVQLEIRDFANSEIKKYATDIDQNQNLPVNLISRISEKGYQSFLIPKEYGGLEKDMIEFGLLNEELGKICSSIRSLITVQAMVSYAILKWGTDKQKNRYLTKISNGGSIAAFALTEPDYGSDARNISTLFEESGNDLLINGTKKWITFGQIADIFLVFGKYHGKTTALLIDKDTEGISLKPISNLLGVRGSMLAEIHFKNCKIGKDQILGSIGTGLNPIGFGTLNIGRYSIAFGCLGMAEACFESAVVYSGSRIQFGQLIREHQLIQELISNMLVDIKTANLLCHNAGLLMNSGNPACFKEVMVAKYHASRVALNAANNAVQIHGANGCSDNYSVERFYRDAKIMEIIEGSNQMLQIMLSKYSFQEIKNL